MQPVEIRLKRNGFAGQERFVVHSYLTLLYWIYHEWFIKPENIILKTTNGQVILNLDMIRALPSTPNIIAYSEGESMLPEVCEACGRARYNSFICRVCKHNPFNSN